MPIPSPSCRRMSLSTCLAALTALLSLSSAAGQSPGASEGGTPFVSSGAGTTHVGTTPFRLWHSTRGYAQEESDTAFGGRWATDIGTGIFFVDGQFRMSNTSDFGMNVGGGFRWWHAGLLTGDPRIFGVSGWYDGDETNRKNYFNQGGVSFESLGEWIDLRLNANLPGEDVLLSDSSFVGDLAYVGNNLAQSTFNNADIGLSNVNFEAAVRIPGFNLWTYGGGYQLDGEGFSETGYKAGFRGYAYNDLLLDLGVSDDDTFGTLTTFQVVWTPGRTSPGVSHNLHRIGDRMREQVFRPSYVATVQRAVTTSVTTATSASGAAIEIVHVDSTAAGPGDGTFENPLSSLNSVQANSSAGAIVLVHSGTSYSGQSVQLQSGQRLLGEGGGVTHTVATSNFGTIALPATASGSLADAIPLIAGAPTAAIQAGAGIADPTAQVEANNFRITGGGSGVLSTAAGTGTLRLANLDIESTGGSGVEIVNSNWNHVVTGTTIADAGNVAGEAAVRVSGGDADLNFTGRITQGAAASGAAAVLVQNGHTGTLTFTEQQADEGLIDAQNGTGLQFDGADGVYTFNDNVKLRGGDAGIDLVNDSDGTVTLADAEITDPTGTAVNVDGGDASMTFTGKVTQSNNASAMAVANGHNGTIVFNEKSSGAGVFAVSNGNGLQFNQADGAYTFNHAVVLAGGDAAIDVVNSDGTFTVANGAITNPTGEALVIDGGDAIMTFTGKVTQNNNQTAVAVRGGHTGSLILAERTAGSGVVEARNGAGLVFNNADGDYAFNHQVLLDGTANGAATRLNVGNGSDGNITIANGEITSPTGVAVDVDGGGVDLTFTGRVVQANNFAAVEVTGGHSGNLTFNERTLNAGVVQATNGTGLQFNNADGVYAFNAGVSLAGGDAGIDIAGGSSGTFTFDADSEITNASGGGLRVDGSNASVVYSGDIVNNANQAVVISGNTGGSVTVTGSVTDTGAGILVQNNTGGSFRFSGLADLTTGANAAVRVLNNSAGNTRFDNLDITTTTGAGMQVADTNSVEVSGSNNRIVSGAATALSISDSTVGSLGVNFRSVSADGGTNGIALSNVSGGAVNIGVGASGSGDGGVVQNTSAAAVVASNVASLSLNNLRIENAAGDGVSLAHSNGTASVMTVSNNRVTGITGSGISLNATGSASYRLTANANNVDDTSLPGVALNFNGDATSNILLTNNLVTNSNNVEALELVATGASPKTVTVRLEDNTFNNNDATAFAADLRAEGNVNLNATVVSNNFSNANLTTGVPARVRADNAAANVRLNLDGNIATPANAANNGYRLEQVNGSFSLQNQATVQTRNTGTVNQSGTIVNDPGGIPTP